MHKFTTPVFTIGALYFLSYWLFDGTPFQYQVGTGLMLAAGVGQYVGSQWTATK